MAEGWAEKFKQQLKEKEIARQETKKSFQIYQEASLRLFDWVEKKIKVVQVISTSRFMLGQSENATSSVKALKLKCQEKFLEFIPEGINLDSSKGRIRMKHNSKSLTPFIYLYLTIDPQSTAAYPDNLVWVFNDKNAENIENLPAFNEKVLESLIETVFLE